MKGRALCHRVFLESSFSGIDEKACIPGRMFRFESWPEQRSFSFVVADHVSFESGQDANLGQAEVPFKS
eukprot:scaffold3073_cov66-Cylindrotheca_fusiformis.AAC.22